VLTEDQKIVPMIMIPSGHHVWFGIRMAADCRMSMRIAFEPLLRRQGNTRSCKQEEKEKLYSGIHVIS